MEDFVKKNPTYVRKTEKQVLTKYEKKLNDRNLGKPEKPPLYVVSQSQDTNVDN